MTENKSTYGGRKIRIEGKDDLIDTPSASGGEAEQGFITLREADSKGLLKPGMVVLFNNCVWGPIELDQEMTGKKQQISYELTEGVIVKKQDGKFVIFSVLNFLKEGIILKGRYGRANGSEAINYVVRSVSKKIRKCNVRILTIAEFVNFCNDNYLVLSYFMQSPCGHCDVLFDNFQKIRANTLHYGCININPGSVEHAFYNIAVIIEGEDIECCIKNGSAKKITQLHTYQENPHDKYVEIRGGS